MARRRARRAESWACAWALWGCLFGCKTVDRSLLEPRDAGPRDAAVDAAPLDGRMPMPDGGPDTGADGSDCKASTEECNGKDDDCDDKVDEGGDEWCAMNVIQNAPAVCEPTDGAAACYWLGDCDVGYASCDGDPANGCESDYCDCKPCDDAGMDDAGG